MSIYVTLDNIDKLESSYNSPNILVFICLSLI